MTAASPSLVDVIKDAIDSRLLEVHTGFPATVDSYNAGAGTVDVTPCISRVLRDEDDERIVERMPRMLSVPVLFPGAGGYSITFPIAQGDTVMVMVGEFPLGEWLANENTDPQDERRHSLAGAIAYPCIRPTSKASANATTDKIVIAGGPVYLGTKNAAEAIPKGNTLDNYLSQIDIWLTALFSAYNAHTHSSFGSALVPIPQPPPTKPDTKSSKHKLDE